MPRRPRELIPGGLASGMRPSDFDAVELRRGTRVEMEHTRDPRIAREIAMDHLAEDPGYYRKLARIHREPNAVAVAAAERQERLRELHSEERRIESWLRTQRDEPPSGWVEDERRRQLRIRLAEERIVLVRSEISKLARAPFRRRANPMLALWAASLLMPSD